ncbi:winged helix-turn-helix transcriptional regulator [Chitinophaga nivalis]|uniref:Helix-turn-helix transcriptional regulator n=1 Tax=Chitinophaga nivalis TaxID=2991709 RepID=A0ABT3IH89_9BACT|nr:helix-turn-helix domain-containing protein [Chitinophaga nivalis]MCW3466977.1 helix-turn-helix transcriptional regulator [Chitinophaga nivalis]MCW3483332.1 helix-turn-helix transcriptional regulator [Chitinophaga nivalis]
MKKKDRIVEMAACSYNRLAIMDAVAMLSGKWKIPVLGVLMQHGSLCFLDIVRHVPGISAKTLTKELREMASNQLVTRTVLNTRPVTVEYTLTEYGRTLDKAVFELLTWGLAHRKRLIGKDTLGEKSVHNYIAEMQQDWPVNRAG